MSESYDVVVVGAGPAGSIAARAAAREGARVLLIEKRQTIGDPVRCAEGIAKEAVHRHIDPDPRWIAAEVEGFRIVSPDGTPLEMRGVSSGEVGYVLERKLFDRALASDAVQHGVDVRVKTRAVGLLRSDGAVRGVVMEHLGERHEVEAGVVIGADGIESKVGRWAGIDTRLALKDIDVCAQMLVHDPSIDQSICQFYLGNEVAPGGYAWIFPKGNECANVGLGMLGSRSNGGLPMQRLRRFVSERLPKANILEVMVGGVPVSEPMHGIVADGLMLVGDAAHQSSALTGGGLANAMDAGAIAGRVAAAAIADEDTSRERLSEYEREWFELKGKSLKRDWVVKERLVKLTDEQLNGFMHSLQGVEFREMHVHEILVHLLKRNPKLLWWLKDLL